MHKKYGRQIRRDASFLVEKTLASFPIAKVQTTEERIETNGSHH